MNEYDEKRLDIAEQESTKYYRGRVTEVEYGLYHIDIRTEKLILDFESENFWIRDESKEDDKLICEDYCEAIYRFTRRLRDKKYT